MNSVSNKQFFLSILGDKSELVFDAQDAIIETQLDDEESVLTLPSGRQVANFRKSLANHIVDSSSKPRRFLTPVLQPDQQVPSVPRGIYDLIDSEYRPLLTQLYRYFWSTYNPGSPILEPHPNILLLGSLCLADIDTLLKACPDAVNIIVLEHSYENLALLSHSVELSSVVEILKRRSIGLSILFDEDATKLTENLQRHILNAEPTSVYRLDIIPPLLVTPELTYIQGWIESPEGLQITINLLYGNETDELNHLLNLLRNLSPLSPSKTKTYAFAPITSKDSNQLPVILTASGPSLDGSLALIQKLSENTLVVSAGSSFGTLVRSGIRVDICVFVEMASIVYFDMLDLVREGYDFSQTTLVCSASIDPRILQFFKEAIYFTKPSFGFFRHLSEQDQRAALPQGGPQVANAALEFLLMASFDTFYLFGCDFSSSAPSIPRSSHALGVSIRNLELPTTGLRGKTIFSDAELLVTARHFSEMLSLFGATAYTTTDTVSSTSIKLVNSDELLSIHSDSFDLSDTDKVLENIKCGYSPVSFTTLTAAISSASTSLRFLQTTLVSSIRHSNQWDRGLQKEINKIISFNKETPGSPESFFELQIRSLLLLLLRPLASSSPSHDSLSKAVINTLDQMFDALLVFYDALDHIYSSKQISPHWSPGEMKAAIRRSYRSDGVDPTLPA